MKSRLAASLSGAALALLVAVAGVALAQDAGFSAQIAQIKDAGYPNAQAVVTIDDTGSPAPELTAADFAVTIDGKPAPVSAASLASSETAPLDVLFLVDTSGSMAGQAIAQTKAAANAFIAQLAPQDRVAIIAFSDSVRKLQDYTTDHAAASAIIDSMQAGGNTALYQATGAAALTAARSTASRRAVILLSDGGDYGSIGTLTRAAAIDAVAKVGVPWYAIGEGTDIDSAYLQQLASASNGRYLQAPDPKQLTDLYAGIARLLHSQYVVTFDASAITAARDASVSITVSSGGRNATSTATYAAPPPPAAALTITGLTEGEQLTSARTITADVTGATPASVVFSVDGHDVATLTAAPYTYKFDPAAFSSGTHSLSVRAEGAGAPAAVTRGFSSAAPAAAPGGGMSPLLLAGGAAALIVVLLAVGGGVFLLRRRRHGGGEMPHATLHIASMRARAPAVAPPPEQEAPAVVREVVAEPKGVLISRAGSDFGSEYVIGGTAVSVGSGERCAVRIDDRGLSAVEARVWVRGRQLMLHRITSINALANEGVSGGWVILDIGDTFEIGPHSYEFRLLETAPAPAAPVSDILRDDSDLARPPAPAPTQAQAEAPSLRLVELMPKNDVQEPDGPAQRAS